MSTTVAPIDLRGPFTGLAPEDGTRADMYAVIASLFYGPPSRELLDAIASAPSLEGEGEATLPAAWQALREAAARADPEVLRNEFDESFVSIGEPRVLLYASYYLTGSLHDRPLVALRDAFARLGLRRKEDVHEPEDHISAAADVMRHLITQGGAGELETQRDFFNSFIRPWYGQLTARIEEVPELDFYRVVGRFTRAFLDLEMASFDLETV